MKIKHLAMAASTLTLMAATAHAQATAPAGTDMAPPPATTTAATPDTGSDAAAPAAPAESMAPSATSPAASSDVSAVVGTATVSNGPVADTPENRAKYGQPMSRAGKRTAAKGN